MCTNYYANCARFDRSSNDHRTSLQVICTQDVPIQLRTEEISDESYLEATGVVGPAKQTANNVKLTQATLYVAILFTRLATNSCNVIKPSW